MDWGKQRTSIRSRAELTSGNVERSQTSEGKKRKVEICGGAQFRSWGGFGAGNPSKVVVMRWALEGVAVERVRESTMSYSPSHDMDDVNDNDDNGIEG